MFDGLLVHRACHTKTVAGMEQAIDLRSVPCPLLDLVEVPGVGDQWIGGLLVEVNVVWLRIGHGESIPGGLASTVPLTNREIDLSADDLRDQSGQHCRP
jgi:hypothetical protein